MAGLIGRLGKLERLFGPVAVHTQTCGDCGLEHAPREWTIVAARSLFGVYRPGHPDYQELGPLCLCVCCERSRGLAELTHR